MLVRDRLDRVGESKKRGRGTGCGRPQAMQTGWRVPGCLAGRHEESATLELRARQGRTSVGMGSNLAIILLWY